MYLWNHQDIKTMVTYAKEKTLELKPHLGTEIDEAIEFYNSVVAVNE